MFRSSIHIINIIIAVIIAFSPVYAYGAKTVDTMTGSFDEHFKTLQVSLNGNPFAPPVLVIGSDDVLTFSFDHLADDRAFFRFKLIHCNADWQPSSLVDSEIVDGFNECTIEDYAFSQSTTVNYVNYRFSIPNNDIAPLVSGNYLVVVYEENRPEQIVAQWRFMVSEQSVRIGSEITTRTDIDYNKSHQQLSVYVDSERDVVADPFNDLKVYIQQNGRLDNEVMVIHPLRMSGRTAVYEHLAPLIFDAGNEYRRFESLAPDRLGMHIADIQYHYPYHHIILEEDGIRADESYLYDSTQQGRYFIRTLDAIDPNDSSTMADYVVVHFLLNCDELPDAMIFIDGDLTDRRIDASSRMTYNKMQGRYEKAMLLKQGSYNYQYLAVTPGGNQGKTETVEGDKFQTVNSYIIKVYTRRPGERYDRLIGVSHIMSDN